MELFNVQDLTSEFAVMDVVLVMVLSFVTSAFIGWIYKITHRGTSYTQSFVFTLVLNGMIVALVMMIVGSNIARAFSLVGALSIIRFRTAIKDPEELLLLFMAIAIGLGLGADQQIPTVIATCVLMAVLIGRRLFSLRAKKRNLYLNIRVPGDKTTATFESVNEILARHAQFVDMRRADHLDHSLQLTYFLDCKDPNQLARLMGDLEHTLPGCSFSFIDQAHVPG